VCVRPLSLSSVCARVCGFCHLFGVQERVCGPGCRSGSSLYIYRVLLVECFGGIASGGARLLRYLARERTFRGLGSLRHESQLAKTCFWLEGGGHETSHTEALLPAKALRKSAIYWINT